jgi:ABC-type sugar transport system substrate-binding protein
VLGRRTTAPIWLCLVAALVLAAAGCGDDDDGDAGGGSGGEQRTFSYIPHLTGHPVWLVAKDGWDDAGKRMNFEAGWTGSTTGDVGELVQALDAAINRQVDGIAIAAINPSAMNASINRAEEAGIPVVTILADAPDSSRQAFLGSNEEEIGRLAAEGLSDATGGEGKVGVVLASLDVENQRKILDAFEQNLPSGMEVVAKEADNSDLQVSTQKIEAMLTAHPDLKGIFGINANVPIAACKVFKERKLAGKVAMIGMDDLKESLACVKDGTISGVVAQNFYGAGFLAGDLLEKLAAGEKVPEINDSGVALVTKETMDTYKKEFQEVAK